MKKINKLLLLISSAALLFSACTEIGSDASSGSAASSGTFVKIVDSSDERTIAPAIGKNAEGLNYVYTLYGAPVSADDRDLFADAYLLSDKRVKDWNKFIAKAIPITGNGKYDFGLLAESYNGSDTYYDPIKIKLSGVDITPGETNKLAFTPENGAVYDVTVAKPHPGAYKGGINVTFKGLSGVTGAMVELLDDTGTARSATIPFTQKWVTSPSGTEITNKIQTLSNNTINYKLDRDSATEQLAGGQYYLRLTLYADHSFKDIAKLNSYKESVLVVGGLTSTATRTFDSANLNKVHKVTYHNADMTKVATGQSYSEAYTRYTDEVSVPFGTRAFDVEGKTFKAWCDAEGNEVTIDAGKLKIADAETAKVINDNGDIDLYASWTVDFDAIKRTLSADVKVGDIVLDNGWVIPYEAGLVLDTFTSSDIKNTKVVGVVFYNNIGAAATKAGLGERILVVAPKNSYDVGYSWVEKTDEKDGAPVIKGAQLVKELGVYVGGESTGEIKAEEKYQYGSTVYRKWFDADDKSTHFGLLSGDSLKILKDFDPADTAAGKLNASYPAFGYVNDLRKDMTFANITESRAPDEGYYLPSVAELLELSSNVATVNKSLALKLIRAKGAGSETVTVGDQLSGRFWSCSQALGTQSQRAWSVDLDTGSAGHSVSGNFGSQTKSDKTAEFKVCGVIGYTK